MKNLLRILTTGRFWVHISLIVLVLFVIIKLVLVWIGMYTQHGEYLVVPKLTELSLFEVESKLENMDLSFEITDSVYSDAVPRGVVVTQNPNPEMKVKQGRTIFLSVNSILPEMVLMPELMGKSRRIAIPLVEITGLVVEELIYQPDESCTDCVIGQRYKGEKIEPGQLIRKGEKITLILGKESNEETNVPELLGMTYNDATQIIQSRSLNVGDIIYCTGCETEADTLNAFVLTQIPNQGNAVKLGSFVDVYLTTDSSAARVIRAVNDTVR